MWPFTKTSTAGAIPASTPIAADGPWEVKKYDDNGSPLVVRVNMGLKSTFGQLGYGYFVSVSAPFRSPTKNGLPTNLETIELDAIEHLLREQLEADGCAILALVITTKGRREFVFYAAQDGPVKQAFPSLQSDVQSHEVQLQTRPEKSWDSYRRFIS